MHAELAKMGDNSICPVAIIVRGGKVLMGRRHYTPDRWKTIAVWTCPGGRCDAGESVETALRREVEEETGIQDLEIVGFIAKILGAKEGDTVPLFLCRTKGEARVREPHKFSAWKWFGAEDYPEDFINDHVRAVILKVLSESV